MCLCIVRRDMLRLAGAVAGAGAGAALLAGCRPDEPPVTRADPADPLRQPGVKWLDVHCHVFNASDLPMLQFIWQTRLRGQFPGEIAAPLVALVAGGLKGQALSPAQEEAKLLGPAAGLAAAAAPRPGTQRLFGMRVSGGAGPARLTAEAVEDPDDPLPALRRLRSAATRPAGPAAAVAALSAGPRLAPAVTAAAPGAAPDITALFDKALTDEGIRGKPAPADPPDEKELEGFAEKIRADGDRGLLGVWFRWGLLFARDRTAIVDGLVGTYPAGATVFLAPAMVDYDRWLEVPDAEDTSPAAQTRIMRVIGEMQARCARPVHAFLPFDPWRALAATADPDAAIAPVQAAIRRGDGIGLKLYPPMGFGAAGNAGRGAATFPPALQGLATKRGSHPGVMLDAVLDRLFDWCAAEGVPVMAHCGASNYTEWGAEGRFAGPEVWRAALCRGGPRRRELRLNLGHFGGIWDFERRDSGGQRWARSIVAMMAEKGPMGGPAFPNLYADIGFFDTALRSGADAVAKRGEAVRFMTEMAGLGGGVLGDRLMYGSDWSMVGNQAGAEEYPYLAVAVMRRFWKDSLQEKLRWANAARYLGLGAGEGTRRRLEERFYPGLGAPALAALRAFDPG